MQPKDKKRAHSQRIARPPEELCFPQGKCNINTLIVVSYVDKAPGHPENQPVRSRIQEPNPRLLFSLVLAANVQEHIFAAQKPPRAEVWNRVPYRSVSENANSCFFISMGDKSARQGFLPKLDFG